MDLSIVRGDTGKFIFYRKNNNGEIIKTTPQALYFSVKNNAYEKEPIIQKKLSDIELDTDTGKYTFYIMPEETNKLLYGTYEYDLEVKDIIDSVEYTKTIAKGSFEIKEEITFASNEV